MVQISSKTKSQTLKKARTESVRVLGIDPGFGRMGFGVIEETRGDLRVIDYGCLETQKTETIAQRLLELKKFIDQLVCDARPVVVAVESLFFSKNVKTALAVGEARGVILFALAEHGLPVFELSPQEVKLAVTGYGNAEKGQVQRMVQKILGLAKIPKPDDAADALALAIAAAQMRRFLNKL
ncbi:MAG: crossover junction endodeoxyribonuclease RuvC [bacterium]|nr:crossover junction endodeoxyribonuclease RuvC [bacterium]